MTTRIFGLVILIFMVRGLGVSQVKESPSYLLKNPKEIILELSHRKAELNEDPSDLLNPYTTSSKIYFRIMATNTSLGPVTLLIMDPYFQNRPILFRDGDIMPYRTGLDALLTSKDKEPFSRMSQTVNLLRNDKKFIGPIYVEDWYGRLPIGHYQLSLKHRFEPGQEWIESSSITFDVVSENGTDSSSKRRAR